MYRSTTRWTTAVAAVALIALPLAASAQQTPPPAQPPQTTQQPQTAPAPAAGQLDSAAAKTHLSAARDTLSQLTSMPEAAKLEGDARTQVSQVIATFNELITTQTNWRSTYAKVDANLTALLGPETEEPAASGVTGAVGTAGAAPAAAGMQGMQMDPPIRAKLVEFRKHLKGFEKAAGGPAPAAAPGEPAVSGSAAVTGATGTSGMTPPPASGANPSDQTKAPEQAGHSEADRHLDAISAILQKSKTGALTRAQTTELKRHVAELRALLKQGK